MSGTARRCPRDLHDLLQPSLLAAQRDHLPPEDLGGRLLPALEALVQRVAASASNWSTRPRGARAWPRPTSPARPSSDREASAGAASRQTDRAPRRCRRARAGVRAASARAAPAAERRRPLADCASSVARAMHSGRLSGPRTPSGHRKHARERALVADTPGHLERLARELRRRDASAPVGERRRQATHDLARSGPSCQPTRERPLQQIHQHGLGLRRAEVEEELAAEPSAARRQPRRVASCSAR